MANQGDKTALITGASSGIGRELANLLAQDGYNLVLVARNQEGLQQVAQEFRQQYGIQTTVIAKDLMDPKAPEEIYDETRRQGLTVQVLVNNAGMGEYGLFATDSDLQKELGIIQLNATSLVHLTKLYLQDMITHNEGKILMLGSVASVMPNPMMAVYGATKAFIYSFAEALHNELKDSPITVTVLMPPATDTDFFNKAGASHTVAQQMAHSMSPAEVAQIGYKALLQGKDKAVAGFQAKLMTASAYLLPDPLVTQNHRNLMKSQEEVARQSQPMTTALALGLAALAVGGVWLAYRNRRELMVIPGKARSARRPIQHAFDKVANATRHTYEDARSSIKQALR